MNYHDVVLTKSVDGKVRGIDVYVLYEGEYVSTTMKRFLLPAAMSLDATMSKSMTRYHQLLVEHQPDIMKMADFAVGNPAEAIRIFHLLPEELHHDKSIMMLRFMAAQQSGDNDEYSRAMADFRKYFPDDPCIDFISIDYFTGLREFGRALQAIDSVKRLVGEETCLNMTRANVLCEDGQLQEAELLVNKAISYEPGVIDVWWTLVTLELKRKNFEKVLMALKEIDQRFEMHWPDLTDDPAYGEFIRSPEFQQWVEYQATEK